MPVFGKFITFEIILTLLLILSDVVTAYGNGRLTMRRIGSTSELVITVNPAPLTVLLAKYATEAQTSGMSTDSQRVKQLLDMCSKLRDLRLNCQKGEWQTVWLAIQADWKDFKKDANPAVNESESTGPFVPPSIRAQAAAEIQDISLSAINYFIVPRLNTALSHNFVPIVPFYCGANGVQSGEKIAILDTSELSSELSAAEEYTSYFDTSLISYINSVKEHLLVRQAVNSTDRALILQTVEQLKDTKCKIPQSHEDRVNTLKYTTLFELESRLYDCLLTQGVNTTTQIQGSVDFSLLNIKPFVDLLESVRKFPVQGAEWVTLVSICENINRLRVALHGNNFTLASEVLSVVTSLPEWTASVKQSVANSRRGSLKSTENDRFLSTVLVLQTEITVYRTEIAHINAMSRITTLIRGSAISGEVDALLLSGGDSSGSGEFTSSSIKQVIETVRSDLINNTASIALLKNCNTLLDLRDMVTDKDWQMVEATVAMLRDDSNHFTDCHIVCRDELILVYNEAFNRKIKAELLAAISIGVMVFDAEHFSVELSDHMEVADGPIEVQRDFNLVEMKRIIDFAAGGYILSHSCANLLKATKTLYCLRFTVSNNRWEPETSLYCGDSAADELPAAIVDLDKDPVLATELRNVGSTIVSIHGLELSLFNEKLCKRMEKGDAKRVTVCEVLSYVQNSALYQLSCYDLISNEVNLIKQLVVDRHCRVSLLLAACSGKVRGDMESLRCKTVNTHNLQVALTYTENQIKTHKLSNETINWLSTAQMLLRVREAAKLCDTDTESGKTPLILNEQVTAVDVKTTIDTTLPGFPTAELTLILNKVNDLNAVEELSQAMQYGAPAFMNGKFDVSRVHFSHLFERLDSAKKLSVRSDRLDRLFFYAELCVNLRKSVSAYQWDLSITGEKTTVVLDRNIVTVKTCMAEYEQAKKFFRTEVIGVPPQWLKDEFLLVSREWDRRLMLQRFSNAFRIGEW